MEKNVAFVICAANVFKSFVTNLWINNNQKFCPKNAFFIIIVYIMISKLLNFKSPPGGLKYYFPISKTAFTWKLSLIFLKSISESPVVFDDITLFAYNILGPG